MIIGIYFQLIFLYLPIYLVPNCNTQYDVLWVALLDTPKKPGA